MRIICVGICVFVFCGLFQASVSVSEPVSDDVKIAGEMGAVLEGLFKMTRTGDFTSLSDPELYAGLKSDASGTRTAREIPTGLSIRVSENMAEVILDRISEPMHHALLREMSRAFGLPHHVTQSKTQFVYTTRSADFEHEDHYFEGIYQVDLPEGKLRVRVGMYRRGRAEATTVFFQPDAAWLVENKAAGPGGLYNPMAGVVMDLHSKDPGDIYGIHRLTFIYHNLKPCLVLEPGFYPMWGKRII